MTISSEARLSSEITRVRWVPSHRDRVGLKDTGVVRTRRDDAATVEQVIKGIPGKQAVVAATS